MFRNDMREHFLGHVIRSNKVRAQQHNCCLGNFDSTAYNGPSVRAGRDHLVREEGKLSSLLQRFQMNKEPSEPTLIIASVSEKYFV